MMPASLTGDQEVLSLRDYYRTPAVRRRIREYCGGTPGHTSASCIYLAALDASTGPFTTWEKATFHPPERLDTLLDGEVDLARSMWDRSSMIVHLDIDYLNVDAPQEAFAHPADVFLKLEPVYAAIHELLHEYRLPLLGLMTAEGYHFVGRVPWTDVAIPRLVALCPEPPDPRAWLPRGRTPWVSSAPRDVEARAYVGLGLVMEHLGHRILVATHGVATIPVVLNGTVVGPTVKDRECVSIDLSFAGDPLEERHVRVAFGAYQRHRWRPDVVGAEVASRIPPLVVIPRGRMSLQQVLLTGRGTDRARELAARSHVRIPTAGRGLSRLLSEYERSPIAAVHRRFYAESRMTETAAAALRAGLAGEPLPPCVSGILAQPNDRLLQPTGLQHVTRALMSVGLSPRQVAGLVESLYRADFQWGDRWRKLDPHQRADFDVRVFSTLLRTGLDRATDFNCVSAQEKGLCPRTGCPHDLRVDRDRLLAAVAP